MPLGFIVLGSLVAMNVGPVVGGYTADTVGFKWAFLVSGIASALGAAFAFCVLRETDASTLRIRLAARQDAETRSIEQGVLVDPRKDARRYLWSSFSGPFILLFSNFTCASFSVHLGLYVFLSRRKEQES